ncbi:MAG: hypothetical protein LBE56_13105 [Tannerella sp.]|jgi:hypothetical protein|nr:hypothetical protein [Tannerella sp.]
MKYKNTSRLSRLLSREKIRRWLYTALITCMIGTIFPGCEKSEDDNPFPEEDPLEAYLSAAGFSSGDVTSQMITEDTEAGLVFTPQVDGIINAIIVKIPNHKENLRVTLWDADAKTVLLTTYIPMAHNDIEFIQDIAPFNVTKGVSYAITMNVTSYYQHLKSGNAPSYPITAGNIVIDQSLRQVTSQQIFPESDISNSYIGNISFVFRQTE